MATTSVASLAQIQYMAPRHEKGAKRSLDGGLGERGRAPPIATRREIVGGPEKIEAIVGTISDSTNDSFHYLGLLCH